MTTTSSPPRRQVPKLCGADIELGNAILGLAREDGTGPEAARALLREIDGLPRRGNPPPLAAGAWGVAYDPQDWGRKFLPGNGGCVYIDLDHLEVCIPEVLDAYDHVAATRAMLAIAHRAQQAAGAKLPPGQRLQVLVNNSDGQSNSYGSHLNVLITRRAWEDIFHRRRRALFFLAAFQASSIVVTGQGKVGSENGAPPVAFQIAQRADFFEAFCGVQTTFNRPLVNARAEPLCGDRDDLARLHCIFFDSTLCQVAGLLKVGLMQIVLAMIEAEAVDPRLILDDAVAAVRRWSHDPTLRVRAAVLDGRRLTAVELQLAFAERVGRFVAAGGCDGVVPHAAEIVAVWQDTLAKLEARDWPALARRLDWALKRVLLERVIGEHPELTWSSPAIRHLDLLYASLDPSEGLFWAYERGGRVDCVVSPARIAHFVDHPPDDTRAWARAALLRRADPETVVAVDWDSITLAPDGRFACAPLRRIALADPLRFTRAEIERTPSPPGKGSE